MAWARATWVDVGNDANYDLLSAHRITAPYYASHDPRVTSDYLEGVRARGLEPGLYFSHHWRPQDDGPAFAGYIDGELRRIAWAGNAPVAAEIEKGSGLGDANYVDFVVAFVRRWRELRPARRLDWILEPFQGGLFNGRGDAVSAIAGANVGIFPEHYGGAMQPFAADRVLLDLLLYGFPMQRTAGVYDAARVGTPGSPLINWEGYAYTMGRLQW